MFFKFKGKHGELYTVYKYYSPVASRTNHYEMYKLAIEIDSLAILGTRCPKLVFWGVKTNLLARLFFLSEAFGGNLWPCHVQGLRKPPPSSDRGPSMLSIQHPRVSPVGNLLCLLAFSRLRLQKIQDKLLASEPCLASAACLPQKLASTDHGD